jgi:hypothetical protein
VCPSWHANKKIASILLLFCFYSASILLIYSAHILLIFCLYSAHVLLKFCFYFAYTVESTTASECQNMLSFWMSICTATLTNAWPHSFLNSFTDFWVRPILSGLKSIFRPTCWNFAEVLLKFCLSIAYCFIALFLHIVAFLQFLNTEKFLSSLEHFLVQHR